MLKHTYNLIYTTTLSEKTFHLFWVKALVSQGRTALLCSETARPISHKNEWFHDFFLHFCDSFYYRHLFLLITYIPRGKDTKSVLLAYNLLTTELQKLPHLPLFYCQKRTRTSLVFKTKSELKCQLVSITEILCDLINDDSFFTL